MLSKREAYRKAFAGFDPERIARYGKRQIDALLRNDGIIRNRAKMLVAINKAKRFLDIQEEFGIVRFLHLALCRWPAHRQPTARVEGLSGPEPRVRRHEQGPNRRGFKFVGSTICYAHMQAMGMVNDHAVDCFRRREILERFS